MKFHLQRIKHDPENGFYGDCHRAALASILGLEYEEIPHFMDNLGPDDGEAFNKNQYDFLKSLKLVPIIFPIIFPEDNSLELVLAQLEIWNPNIPYLLGGESASNCGHSVVCHRERIIWDPSPNRVGIIGPMKDGFYWITYIGQLIQ